MVCLFKPVCVLLLFFSIACPYIYILFVYAVYVCVCVNVCGFFVCIAYICLYICACMGAFVYACVCVIIIFYPFEMNDEYILCHV